MSLPAVGSYVCVNAACPVAGYPTTKTACVSCSQPTRDHTEPGLIIPTPTPTQPASGLSLAQTIEKGTDIGSRVVYGGFWVVAAVAFTLGGFVLLGQGDARGLLGLVLAVVAGLYARYIFRGGRLRILFW